VPDELSSPDPGQPISVPGVTWGDLGAGAPQESSPLQEDEPEGVIPPSPLWAMKARRHIQWSSFVGDPPERIREAFGEGNDTVYVIEDGHHHIMVGRPVGLVSDGCQYALVGRAPKSVCEGLRSGQIPSTAVFDHAEQIILCGTDVDERDKASDIFNVELYGHVSNVPVDYLPGRPPVGFSEALPITAP